VNLAYLLDTNILIALLRGRGEAARARLKTENGRLAVSAVTVMELEYGLALSGAGERRRAQVQSLLGLMTPLPFDEAAANNAGRLRAQLDRTGRPIGPYDALIAGHARCLGLTVVTDNVAEFARVPGLMVENWLRP